MNTARAAFSPPAESARARHVWSTQCDKAHTSVSSLSTTRQRHANRSSQQAEVRTGMYKCTRSASSAHIIRFWESETLIRSLAPFFDSLWVVRFPLLRSNMCQLLKLRAASIGKLIALQTIQGRLMDYAGHCVMPYGRCQLLKMRAALHMLRGRCDSSGGGVTAARSRLRVSVGGYGREEYG